MVTAEQFQEWKNHPVTKEIFEKLTNKRQEVIDRIAYGDIIGPSADITLGLLHRAIGNIDGLNQLLHISFEDADVENEVDERTAY